MPVKRQTSISVADLHNTSILTKGIKRLALEHPTDTNSISSTTLSTESSLDIQPDLSKSLESATTLNYPAPPLPQAPAPEEIPTSQPTSKFSKQKLEQMAAYVKTILSQVNEQDFDTKYELGREIGKGGFSCVYQCKDRITGNVYAVKVCLTVFSGQ
jgi:hypothetical protein